MYGLFEAEAKRPLELVEAERHTNQKSPYLSQERRSESRFMHDKETTMLAISTSPQLFLIYGSLRFHNYPTQFPGAIFDCFSHPR